LREQDGLDYDPRSLVKVAMREVAMPRAIRAIARPATLLAVALLLAACGQSGSPTQAPASRSASTQAPGPTKAPEGKPTPGTALTSCELVAPADIEAALKLAAGTVAAGTLEQQPTSLDVADGGLWFEDNDRGYFLKSVVMVRLQFQFIADGTKFRDPSIAIGTAALAKV
jgi:hypothetical protein